ncbi:hypothetical protein DCAR_0310246 [Daucus carota subsp. sativus]|uniref:Secreted protein n=1 Tax=Daucus carota subsp. sativus TaxID=79200 RepID=A0AAF0WMK0_DAUCS|nr:PREDICTED: uncharacterized protein LOC108214348 [Daucus carota subsp. sativus]WOG90998.1 hypothetical protein DCAR_0310246 [Daucus carota subsp. sativus]
MLQLFFAVAFSAVPLTLYVPPIRNLCLFVDTVEQLYHHTAEVFSLQLRPQLRLALSRLLSSPSTIR